MGRDALAITEGLWDQVRATRGADIQESRLEDGVLLREGLFTMFRMNWSAVGQDTDKTEYGLQVVETEPEGIISGKLFPAKHTMNIYLHAQTEDRPEWTPLELFYLGRLSAGKLVEARGSTHVGEEVHRLDFEQAATGIMSAFEVANFKPIGV